MVFNGSYKLGGGADPQIEYSGRFSGAAYLEKTFAGPDATLTAWTFDGWLKRSEFGSEQWIACAGTATTDLEYIRFTSGDKLEYKLTVASTTISNYITTQVFRDTGWYHLHIHRSGTTLVIAVNGTTISTFDTTDAPDTTNSLFGSAVQHRIGADYAGSPANHLGAILSEWNFISGTGTAQTDFGQFDILTPTFWKHKAYTGSHGTNGVHLPFSDAAVLGRDFSGVENKTSSPTSWSWTNTGTITGSYGTDPYGEATSEFEDTDGVSLAYVGNTLTGLAAGEYHTVNIVLKYIDAKTQYFDAFGSITNSQINIYPHPETGTLSLNGANDPEYYGVNDLGGGYYHYWFAFELNAGASGVNVRFGPANNASAESTTTVNSDLGSVEVGAMWLTAGSSPIAFPGYSIGDADNTLSASGMSTADQLTDTPTNDICVLNPLDKHADVTISDGGLEATASTGWRHGRGTLFATAGKLYYEAISVSGAYAEFGWMSDVAGNDHAEEESDNDTTFYRGISAAGRGVYIGSGAADTGPTLFTAGQTVMMAIDIGTMEFWVGINGTWYNSGDPAAGTGATGTMTVDGENRVAPWYGMWTSGVSTFNFGQQPFSYLPTGFTGWTAAAILGAEGEPALRDPSTEFVSAIDTEADIAATLAAARSGWSSYVDVFKNRASESWYWRFSADSSNCFNSDSVDAKEAFPTLAGAANWIGMSLKLDGTANIKGGSASHTNGADTTVTHNAGNARCLIILFPALGGTRPVYHPDLDAGKLLYLDANTAQTTDSFIKNVTANAFDIDTGETTDTYWYLVIPETEGFFDLGTYVSNGSADGPYYDAGISPLWPIIKRISLTEAWESYPSILTENPHGGVLKLDLPDAEAADVRIDHLSKGIKIRSINAAVNSGTYATATFGTSPYYSNGR